MPFGYLEFSRAIGRKPCPHMRACAAAGAGRPVPGRARARARARDRVRVPYPARFFLNRVSRIWVVRSIPATLSGSEQPRQRLSVNRRGSLAVAAIEPNCCNFSSSSDQIAPPGALFIALRFLNLRYTKTKNSSLSLRSELRLSLCSELGLK